MGDITILIVDDESRMRKLIKDFLTQKGYHILEAENGEKALEIYEKQRKQINLILLDVMMPKLDGWSVLRQIRQTSKVPIIMLTARGEEQDELFGFELGVDEYISKPFSPKYFNSSYSLKDNSICFPSTLTVLPSASMVMPP